MNINFDELFLAYIDCRINKRTTTNAIKFEVNLERNLFELYNELVTDIYVPGRFIYFVLTKPKYREVWASNFRDRIIHHFIYNRLKEYYFKRFIFDTYACIPGKGIHAATSRLEKFIRSESQNYQYKTYVLKLDIRNFFITINKEILWNLIKNNHLIKDIDDLVEQLIFHDPTTNYNFKGDVNLKQYIPVHKSLFNAKYNCGLPIGNLTSQFFANVYLNELDQYCKRVLKIKKYIRYVDDIIIVSRDKHWLNFLIKELQVFVNSKLDLSFHLNKIQIIDINNGVDFVGKITYPYHQKLRDSTINSLRNSINTKYVFSELQSSINSYFGMLRQVNGYNIRKLIDSNYSYLKFDNNLTKLVGVSC